MVLASHYVIDEIVKLIESKDKGAAERFSALVQRYPEDGDFSAIYQDYLTASKKSEELALETAAKELRSLTGMRKLETEGGSNLPYKDRRHFSD